MAIGPLSKLETIPADTIAQVEVMSHHRMVSLNLEDMEVQVSNTTFPSKRKETHEVKRRTAAKEFDAETYALHHDVPDTYKGE